MNLPPIIKIEVESMRQCMVHAFSEQLLQMDLLFQQAVNEACRPEAVNQIIKDAAARFLRDAIDEEVKSYLLFGDGRRFIRTEVEKRLKSDLSE